MKTAKHHLINWQSGKTICGLTNFKSDSIRLASFESGKWFDDFGDELDTANWDSIFCMNCLKLHESNLIEQFKLQTFLITYELRLPKSNRAKKKQNSKTRSNRINGIKTESVSAQLDKKIAKSVKGKARAKKKAQSNKAKPIIKSNPITDNIKELWGIQSPTESKCRIINPVKSNKKKKKEKPIELTPQMEVKKPLLDTPTTIEVIEEVPIDDAFRVGDPIDDDSIREMGIDTNWKMVRHDKQLDMWKLQTKSINKKNKVSKWIDDCEFISYKELAEIINSGYCE